tara:strand:- start:339 stop:452 length:114 start_codon:yes stop_codon:yes gene_type:complete
MSEPKKSGIDKKLTTGIVTVTAILTYLFCELGVIPNV